jgi:prolyl oligopeptidase
MSAFDESGSEDPHLWLEDIEGDKVIDWVKSFNVVSTEELTSNPMYDDILRDIKNIVFAKDRIPYGSFEEGYFWNFWEDETYKHGLLRRCSLEEYKQNSPVWEVMLDLDRLSEEEKENWVYSERERFELHSSRGLLYLSRGGKDAVEVREFDFDTGKFVEDGFFVAEAKTRITPIDSDWLLIGSDFGSGTLTQSGYPRQVKLWHRGDDLTTSTLMFEGSESDVMTDASVILDGEVKHIVFVRMIGFFDSEFYYLTTIPVGKSEKDTVLSAYATLTPPLETRKLPIPSTASLLGIKDNFVYIQLKEDHSTENLRSFVTNSILRFPLSADSLSSAEVVFVASFGQSIDSVSVWKNRLFISLLDNVRGKIIEVVRAVDLPLWTAHELPLPNTGMITLTLRHEEDLNDLSTFYFSDHLTPYSQLLLKFSTAVDGEPVSTSVTTELLKQSPPRFDATNFVVSQKFAVSSDGTKIPYFLLHSKSLEYSGTTPTILNGYGGFEVSMTPSYSGLTGKLWLTRGGAYAIANIRGGGEFGPQWHQAALKTKRQCAYNDFYAVAEDLIASGVTSPQHLGIEGGSNGGLLVAVAMTQRPELFKAVLCQVPLIDMIRFHLLLAGASWISEYGDPRIVDEREFLLKISPYHNINRAQSKGDEASTNYVQYPKVFVNTSTKDDRVHPGHARKFVARLQELGHPLLYYENINGGHAGSANLDEYAFVQALEYVFMWKQLQN